MRVLLLVVILAWLCLACDETSGPGEKGPGASGTAPSAASTPVVDVQTVEPVDVSTQELTSTQPGRETALVTRVIDGDTIEVELGGQTVRIRYIGIDTPETVDPSSPVECYGLEASERNRELVAGRTVELEKDVSETDQYGRLLRYVYVEDLMVNEQLVLDGYATSFTFPPDVKYQDRLVTAQMEALNAGRGLWVKCFDGAEESESSSCPEGCVAPPPGCEIKGNVNSEGVKIYHVPSGEFYDATVIDTARGERWFCTPGEAIANGWRASRR